MRGICGYHFGHLTFVKSKTSAYSGGCLRYSNMLIGVPFKIAIVFFGILPCPRLIFVGMFAFSQGVVRVRMVLILR